jgi:hypothetical protein
LKDLRGYKNKLKHGSLKMNKEAEKAARERGVFHDFIKKSGLPINPKSVESCCPPKPDILCFQEDEGNVAFELAEICDPDIARIIAQGGGATLASDPSGYVIREKLKKHYQTEYPVELLCYKRKNGLLGPINH